MDEILAWEFEKCLEKFSARLEAGDVTPDEMKLLKGIINTARKLSCHERALVALKANGKGKVKNTI